MSTISTKRQVVLLMSHFFNAKIEEKFHRLREELACHQYDVFLIINTNNKADTRDFPSDIQLCIYDPKDLNELGYTPISSKLLPGSCHFPVLRFYKEHAEYTYYWFIEYDVEFTGEWSVLMDDFCLSSADFIASHVFKYNLQTNGNWYWWNKKCNIGYPLETCIRAFHPICRYSNAALKCIDLYQQKGFYAHSEVLIPTCLFHAGMTLEDFGGSGEFVKEGNENKFYFDYGTEEKCSLRYRPPFPLKEILQNKREKTLYHPVK